jgi:hypothetical protein
LECTEDNHDKQYTLWIEQHAPDAWKVRFHYGRIGKSPLYGEKGTYSTIDLAKAAIAKIQAEKLAKGYVVVGDGTDEVKSMAILPLKTSKMHPLMSGDWNFSIPQVVEYVNIDGFVDNPDFHAQEYVVGDQRIFLGTGLDGCYARDKHGTSDLAPFHFTGGPYVLDGVRQGNLFHAFDILWDNQSLSALSWRLRLERLEHVFNALASSVSWARLVKTVKTKKTKALLVTTSMKRGLPGVIFKHASATYHAAGHGVTVAFVPFPPKSKRNIIV